MVKVGVMSDEHLDVFKNLSSNLINESTGYSTRLHEMVQELKRQKKFMLEQGVEYIIHAGDLFNSRTAINAMTLKAATEVLLYCRYDIKKEFIIAGNHDEYLFDGAITSIIPFGAYEHVKVLDRGTWFVDENISVMGLPHYNSPIEFLDVCKAIREQATVLKNSTTEIPIIFITHQELSDIPLGANGDIFSRTILATSTFSDIQADWVINGHHHFPKRIGNVLIPGSAMQLNYGDAKSKRGCWILDTENKTVKQYENKASKFYVLPYDELKNSPDIVEQAMLNNVYVKVVVDSNATIDTDDKLFNLPNVSVVFTTTETASPDIEVTQANFDPIDILRKLIDGQDDYDKETLTADLNELLEKIN